MPEMPRDYWVLEDEKFEKLSDKCPWKSPNIQIGKAYPPRYCKATDILCKKGYCAVWYFIKSLTE